MPQIINMLPAHNMDEFYSGPLFSVGYNSERTFWQTWGWFVGGVSDAELANFTLLPLGRPSSRSETAPTVRARRFYSLVQSRPAYWRYSGFAGLFDSAIAA